MQAMYDLVASKLHETFDPQISISIGLYDMENELLTFPSAIERGVPLAIPPTPFGLLTRTVAGRTTPVQIEDFANWLAEHGEELLAVGEIPQSILQAPLLRGGKPFGRISLENLDRTNAFSDADVRLLSTLAGSLSVALENARLFDETQRLLAETNERAAELAIINSVQQSLAAKLDMESMYELVGEKIAETIHVPTMSIVTYDLERGETTTRYQIERGVRDQSIPTTPMSGFAKYLVEHAEPIFVNHDIMAWLEERGLTVTLVGESPKSLVFAPLILGGRVGGALSLQNVDREDAFSESDLRLVVTLASSLSVALENARLFDETQRLLSETNERAAELAIINSVQEGLATKLEMRSMYELVGDKIREIFDAQVVAIALYDHATETSRYPYFIEKGVRSPEELVAEFSPVTRVLSTERKTMLMNDVEAWESEHEFIPVLDGEMTKSMVIAPLIVNDAVFGSISLQNLELKPSRRQMSDS